MLMIQVMKVNCGTIVKRRLAHMMDAGFVDFSLPSKCTLHVFDHSAGCFIYVGNRKNTEIYNQCFTCVNAGIKLFNEHFCIVCNAHCKSNGLACPGCLNMIRNWETLFLMGNSYSCLHLLQWNSSCETFRTFAVSFMQALCARQPSAVVWGTTSRDCVMVPLSCCMLFIVSVRSVALSFPEEQAVLVVWLMSSLMQFL